MRRKKIIFILFLVIAPAMFAQLDSIQQLNEVILTDSKLKDFSKGYKVDKLSKEESAQSFSFTDLLRLNSSVYFKENGNGMVSSPSFRGTNASHTAVIWNGININSNFTGQTDFNVVSPVGYDDITIRSGGGGVQYGSGAIGGSIHMNNQFKFGEKNEKSRLHLAYASFQTLKIAADYSIQRETFFLHLNANFIQSENDYSYIGYDKKNEHGEFLRTGFSLNTAKRVSSNSLIGLNSEVVYNDRNFSGSINTIGNDGYEDYHTRNLFRFQKNYEKLRFTARAAHLFEQFKYFPNTESANYDQGLAHSFIANTEFEAYLNPEMKVQGKLEYTVIDAEGDNIGSHQRHTIAAVLLLNHNLNKKFTYGINLRQEFLNDFENPFLFAADARWSITENYQLRANLSRNYKIPTFNDLYWIAGGNLDLKPESSYQFEIGKNFRWGNFNLDIAGYLIKSKDMIKWVPINMSLWKPENLEQTENKGFEATLKYGKSLSQSVFLNLSSRYAYTDAKDLDKEKQLIYVPFHSWTNMISVTTTRFSGYLQYSYNGKVFTTTDNSSVVDGYNLLNLGIDYELSKMIKVGGMVKNIANTYYENVAYRPMPPRNFEFFITLNF